MDELIQRIKKLYSQNSRFVLPKPATLQQIKAVEQRFGFHLPELVHELYLEIGNGGFGPGLSCFEDGSFQGLGYPIDSAVNIYLEQQQSYNLWGLASEWSEALKGLFPICDGGCQYHFMVDCNIENGPVIQYESSGFLSPDAFRVVDSNLRAWLEEWLNDEESQSCFDIAYSALK